MNRRYQLIIQEDESSRKESHENVSILLVDNHNFITIVETRCPKEYQQDIEDMALLKYGDKLNIIRQQAKALDHLPLVQ